jgi:hypothetical protein
VPTPAQQLESERSKYPAMQVDEILVWRAWLLTHQKLYDRFQYDVAIGIAQDPGPAYADNIRKMAVFIRSKRLDAVGWRGNTPYIFEVKRRAGPENVGQLVIYQHWWPFSYPGAPAAQLVLVATDADPHIVPVLAKFAIEYDQVSGVNFSVLGPGRIIPPADQSTGS